MGKKSEVFAKYFHENIDLCIEKSMFPSDLKLSVVTPGNQRHGEITADPLAFCQIYQKYMKNACTTKSLFRLITLT